MSAAQDLLSKWLAAINIRPSLSRSNSDATSSLDKSSVQNDSNVRARTPDTSISAGSSLRKTASSTLSSSRLASPGDKQRDPLVEMRRASGPTSPAPSGPIERSDQSSSRLSSPSIASEANLSKSTVRNAYTNVKTKLGVGRPLFPRRSGSKSSQSKKGSLSGLSPAVSPSIGGSSNYSPRQTWSPGTAQSVASTIEQTGEDVTPLSTNPYFGQATPKASPQAINAIGSAVATNEHIATLRSLGNVLIHPACLALAQLAPSSLIKTANSPYANNAEIPSTTSLSTYLSTSEYGTTSNSSHMPLPTSSTFPHSQASTRAASLGLNNPEQLAASALPLPMTSLSALWRGLRSLEWIQENSEKLASASQIKPIPLEKVDSADGSSSAVRQPIFEVASLLQGIVDLLGPYAAHLNIELVLYHGMQGKSSKPFAFDDASIHELHCEGDEIGLGLAISAVC